MDPWENLLSKSLAVGVGLGAVALFMLLLLVAICILVIALRKKNKRSALLSSRLVYKESFIGSSNPSRRLKMSI